LPGCVQIPGMADVEKIKAAVGQNDLLSGTPPLLSKLD
jgi:hypothetical protein